MKTGLGQDQESFLLLGGAGIGMSLSDLARRFGMNVPGVGYAAGRGKPLAAIITTD